MIRIRRATVAIFASLLTSSACAGSSEARFDHDGFMRPPLEIEVILPAAAANDGGFSVGWAYTTADPGPGWMAPEFDASGWGHGDAGFYFGAGSDPKDVQATPWPAGSSTLWLRRTFSKTGGDLTTARFALWGRWDDELTVYINGAEVAFESSWSSHYRWLFLGDAPDGLIQEDENVLAVKVTDVGGGRYFDMALVDNPLVVLPASGRHTSDDTAAFAAAASEFFRDNGVPAAAIAVMKGPRVVSSWSFGYSDKELTTPLQENAVFRLASLDKTPGAAAMRVLIDNEFYDDISGQWLSLETAVFPLLAAHGFTPPPGATPDPRINLVTIRMLIEHTSGLADLPFIEQVTQALGVTEDQVTSEHFVRWVYGQPLIANPGSGEYSNTGSAILRILVDLLTGGIEQHLRCSVNGAVQAPDFFIAAERLASRHPSEPWYRTRRYPYARWLHLESGLTLAASASSYARFMRAYHLWTGVPLLDPDTGAYAPPDNGWHQFDGKYEGTSTVAIQRRFDEVSFVIFTNCIVDLEPLVARFQQIASEIPASDWYVEADLDGDGVVGALDLAILLGSWDGLVTKTSGCSAPFVRPADLDNDTKVGPRDLALLLGLWGTGLTK